MSFLDIFQSVINELLSLILTLYVDDRIPNVFKRNHTIFTSLSLLIFFDLAEGIENATRPVDPYGALW